MNGRVAKKIRKEVYGDYSLRDRKLFKNPETGQILADERRARYQRVKTMYKTERRSNENTRRDNRQLLEQPSP